MTDEPVYPEPPYVKPGFHLNYCPDNATGFDYLVRQTDPINGYAVAGATNESDAVVLCEALNRQPANPNAEIVPDER